MKKLGLWKELTKVETT